jgi:hypothetical protein
MKKSNLRRSEFIRIRLSSEERRIINSINTKYDFTNVSEHVRRALNYYASNVHPYVFKQLKEVPHEN